MPDAHPHRRALVTERIEEILGEGYSLGKDDVLVYRWDRGYEILEVTHGSGGLGGISFSGAWHPDGSCEGTGICHHCGRTLFDE